MALNDSGTCEWLVGEIVHSHLIERGELEPVVAAFQTDNPAADSAALAEHLVRRGFLTTFQATRLLEGHGRGLVLGPYILVESVGGGSVGTVYKASDDERGGVVALKTIAFHAGTDPVARVDMERRFTREARLALGLTHANVTRLHEIGEADGVQYKRRPRDPLDCD